MTQEWKNESGGEEDVQMPLGAGGGEAPAEEYSAPAKSKINSSTIMLVVAFAAALGVLYFLGLGNKPRVASADQVRNDKNFSDQLDQLLSNKNEAHKLGTFITDSNNLLNKLKNYFESSAFARDLPVNPFEHDVAPEPIFTATKDSSDPPIDSGATQAAAKLREAAVYFQTLKLQMVMVGHPSMAMINNRMVTAGNQLEMFTISDITTDGVVLVYMDKQYLLKQSNPGGKP